MKYVYLILLVLPLCLTSCEEEVSKGMVTIWGTECGIYAGKASIFIDGNTTGEKITCSSRPPNCPEYKYFVKELNAGQHTAQLQVHSGLFGYSDVGPEVKFTVLKNECKIVALTKYW